MQEIKEKPEIEESLNKRIMNFLKFQNIKGNLVDENIISIPKTKFSYIKLYKLKLKDHVKDITN